MSEKAARRKKAKGAPKRTKRRSPESAWNEAEWRYSGLIAAAMLPMLGGQPSREDEIKELEAILRRCPAYYPALFHLGVLHAAAGRAEPAARLLLDAADRLAQREPCWPEDLDLSGAAIEPLETVLRYDLGRDLLRRLLEHYPDEPSLHDELGAKLVVLGEGDEAIRCFERAVELAPANPHYVCNLGWGFMAVGRLDEAKAHLGRSLGMDPNNEVTLGNYGVLRFLRRKGGTFEDYLLRPLDRKELTRLERRAARDGDYEELDRTVRQWNYDRVEAWRWELCRRREPPDYQEVYKSLRAFLDFVETLFQGTTLLYENLSLLAGSYEAVMHRFILEMYDADAQILGEIQAGLLGFYGFLCEGGLLGERPFEAFRSKVLGMQKSLVAKAERYGEVRRDDSVPEEEKERLREELFEGVHPWPWI